MKCWFLVEPSVNDSVMKCFHWSHLICFLFSVKRWADSEPPSEKAAAEQHANGKLMIILIMIEPWTMIRRWLDDTEDDQYHDYDLVAIHESHNHCHHHHLRQIDMSRVHWLIEGSCLWYKHDSQKASSPIARVGWQANRDQWACASQMLWRRCFWSTGLYTKWDFWSILFQITGLDVTCEKSGMTVNLQFSAPFNGVVFSKGHFSNPACR